MTIRNLFGLLLLLFTACSVPQEPLKFAIITDLHSDIMPDADKRLNAFLSAAEENEVDFIINLGDLVNALPSNRQIAETWKNHPLPKYNVLGNHDMDVCSKEEYMEYIGMKKRYYSFEGGKYHFVVLDANHIKLDEDFIAYKNANFYIDASKRGFIDPEQMEWLNQDLLETNKPCIVLSHQSLERPGACGNAEDVRAILEKQLLPDGSKKVKLALSGHDHTDYMKEINGIPYIQINSASNQWLGSAYASTERFSEEENKNYPNVRKTAPYTDALFATVKASEDKIEIIGMESSFIKPSPKDLGIEGDLHGVPLTPIISNYSISVD